MTVKELIEKLSGFDENLSVYQASTQYGIYGSDDDIAYVPIENIENVEMITAGTVDSDDEIVIIEIS